MNTFDLYIASLRMLAVCQYKAATNYRKSGRFEDKLSATRAFNIAREAQATADRLEGSARD
jgi:hypothetical protein